MGRRLIDLDHATPASSGDTEPHVAGERARAPLVYACAGNSAEARLAEQVAAGLERLGGAEMSSVVAVAADVPSLVRTARSRRPVVAIDGCRQSCCATLLRSRGIPVSHAVRLDELVDATPAEPGYLVELIAERLGLAIPRRAASRYLAPLLDVHPESVAAATVARRLGVTRPSARQALESLRRRGLVERLPDKTFSLTRPGLNAARGAARRQQIVERFLTDFLGYELEAARELAPPLAAALSDDAAGRLVRRLRGRRGGGPPRPPRAGSGSAARSGSPGCGSGR